MSSTSQASMASLTSFCVNLSPQVMRAWLSLKANEVSYFGKNVENDVGNGKIICKCEEVMSVKSVKNISLHDSWESVLDRRVICCIASQIYTCLVLSGFVEGFTFLGNLLFGIDGSFIVEWFEGSNDDIVIIRACKEERKVYLDYF